MYHLTELKPVNVFVLSDVSVFFAVILFALPNTIHPNVYKDNNNKDNLYNLAERVT
jgi:hypothetical protein